jgi:hypothetical protein
MRYFDWFISFRAPNLRREDFIQFYRQGQLDVMRRGSMQAAAQRSKS